MIIILFIAILAILILVHELGHFIAAKKMGMRVDEFGIGFPPRILSFKKGETVYSINLIPLGGFVKIFGEDPDDESISGPDSKRSMVNKPRWAQAIVISAGVLFNLIFAWLLISIGFISGLPMSVNQFGEENAKDPNVVIIDVLSDSPAFEAGLETGDKLLFFETKDADIPSQDGQSNSIQNFTEQEMQIFIASHEGMELNVLYKRGQADAVTTTVTPRTGVIGDIPAVGITTDVIGIVKLSFFKAFVEGFKLTISLVIATAVGLFMFFASLIEGSGSFSQISGPVGIVGLVGSAAQFGFIYLLSFTAFISINLAVINFIPFPALDGGRLLFILIESITRRNIKPAIANSLNLIGFVLLIGLMIAVTYSDILKLF